MKNAYPSFPTQKEAGGGRSRLPEILAKLTPLEEKRRFSIDIRS